MELGTAKQHGFTLSPIHTSSEMTSPGVRSSLEKSLPFEGTKPVGESMKTEPPAGVSLKTETSKRKVTTGLSDRSDLKLLEKRTSKPSALNAEQLPSTPQYLNSSTESGISATSQSSANIDGEHLRKLTSLAPLPRDHAATSDKTRGGVDSTSGMIGKDTYVLKPLEAEKSSTLASLGKSASTQSIGGKLDVQDSSAPVLLAVGSDDPVLGRNTGAPLRSAGLTDVPPPSTIPDCASVSTKSMDKKISRDTLTAVTDIPITPVPDLASQLAELQGSLLTDKPPQVTSTQYSSQPHTQLQASTQGIGIDLPHQASHPLHENITTVELDELATDSVYGNLDIQNIIRAITCEEIASIGKDILKTRRKQSHSPPQMPKRARKATAAGVSVGSKQTEYGTKLKPAQKGITGRKKVQGVPSREQRVVAARQKESMQGQRGMAKQKAGLYSSRESLASKSDSSVQKKKAASVSAHTRSQFSSRGKENGTAPRQLPKKSNLPQRGGNSATKTKSGRPNQVKLSPEVSRRPYSPPTLESISSSPSSMDLIINTHSPGTPHGKTLPRMTNEPFKREVL